ncbi:protein sprint isoform X2 [Ischnura elegans]|uniref:protein sprint isoform X2 n=1 Tax=Ischnura elegans TaxID=197161 RepID=UPI001ED87BE3|nr:protein sprint isoform X2 [Ischnura elegans]
MPPPSSVATDQLAGEGVYWRLQIKRRGNTTISRTSPSTPTAPGHRRYAQVGNALWKTWGDAFLDPYITSAGVPTSRSPTSPRSSPPFPPSTLPSSPSPSPTSPSTNNNGTTTATHNGNNNNNGHLLVHHHRRDASTSSSASSCSAPSAPPPPPLLTSNSSPAPQAPSQPHFRILDAAAPAAAAELKQGAVDGEGKSERQCGREAEEESEEGEEEEEDEEAEEEAACDIGLVERLIRSHPVWFLPGIQRAGAVHLLQGKEEGNFVVRQSSQPDTMAISVRLPRGKGPYIEHYLVQAVSSSPSSTPLSPSTATASTTTPTGGGPQPANLQSPPPQQLSLESSDNRFDSIPALIAHYSQCCDELPVQLTLPRAIREARNRQQLSSLALLGQEFWRYPMANPRPSGGSVVDTAVADGLTPPSSLHSSLSSFGSQSGSAGAKASSPDAVSDPPPPSSIVLNLSPLSDGPSLSSFRAGPSAPRPSPPRGPRPTPPSTLNIVPIAPKAPPTPPPQPAPPPPPPRWAKPAFAAAAAAAAALSGQNFTVTTTVTFSVNNQGALYDPEGPPPAHVEVQLTPPATSPAPQTTTTTPTGAEGGVRKTRSRDKKVARAKESRHYRESDILDSPTVYYRYCSTQSSMADKVSDYEDIWGPSPRESTPPAPKASTPELLTFKPRPPALDLSSPDPPSPKPPDLLERLNAATPDASEPPKHGSPFYAEPADAIARVSSPAQEAAAIVAATAAVPRRRQRGKGDARANQLLHARLASHRHSDPTAALHWAGAPRRGALERIDSSDELTEAPVAEDGRLRLHAHLHRLHAPPPPPQRTAATQPHPGPLSSSVDNLSQLVRGAGRGARGKPVQPPRVGGRGGHRPFHDASWAVDSSWEFIGNEEEEAGEEDPEEEVVPSDADPLDEGASSERRFPPDGALPAPEDAGARITVHHLIAKRMPHLSSLLFEGVAGCGGAAAPSSPAASDAAVVSSRMSSYDNVEGRPEVNAETTLRQHLSSASQASDEDTHTVFSEPWDSSRWDGLINSGSAMPADAEKAASSFLSDAESLVRLSVAAVPPLVSEEETTAAPPAASGDGCGYSPATATGGCFGRTKALQRGKMSELISPPSSTGRTLRGESGCGIGWGVGGAAGGTGGASIRAYALHLAADSSTTFAQNIENFISCTRESRETSPQIVMRNMRQFMSGMKNYLVKHGEREFEKEVEKERLKLKANEFLNLDAILEGVMHRLVVRPLRQHLYCLFVDEYTRNGAIQLLAENIQFARSKAPHELGIRPRICLPSEQSLERICQCLQRLQEVDSPLEKLEHLLCCISTIFNAVKGSAAANGQTRGGLALGADDLLPLLVWVLVRSGMVGAEIEAEYMFGLLHPALLSAGEGAYYLTTLSSAVHVLKSFRAFSEAGGICGSGGQLGLNEGGPSPNGTTALPLCTLDSGPLSDFRAVLRIVVPDEAAGSLATKTLPVRPNMTARDVCRIAAHKARVTNPQDYGLFKLVDGEETLLCDLECPQEVRAMVAQQGKHCVFAYKRIDAKIAWPRTASPPK